MTRTNNPVVGTMPCTDCDTVASLHETKRGKGRGLLYKRCECGCDQRTGAAIQKQWRQAMTPRPGCEHLSEEPEQPNEPAPVLDSEPEETTEPEPEQQPKPEPEQPQTQPKKAAAAGSFMPVFAGLLAVGLFILTKGGGGPMA